MVCDCSRCAQGSDFLNIIIREKAGMRTGEACIGIHHSPRDGVEKTSKANAHRGSLGEDVKPELMRVR